MSGADETAAAEASVGLRRWQRAAFDAFLGAGSPEDFLVHATPGAGKTRFAGVLARHLLDSRRINRILVVTPTDHLRTQWADALRTVGIDLDPRADNSVARLRADSHGAVVTYAQVAMKPAVHRGRCEARRTLVLLDEIHHCGDAATWGEAVTEAFGHARHRVGLTGTPFRSAPGERIPFIRYVEGDEPDEIVCEPDVSYGYAEALADGVVRPVMFAAYGGVARWQTGDSVQSATRSAALGEAGLSRADEDAAWRTALDPRGQWVRHVLAAMDDRISALRRAGMPRAAGLVLASDQDTARAYGRVAEEVLGYLPAVILSDDPAATRKIGEFEEADDRMAIAVRMISEGVDIPRVAVLGYLSRAAKDLIWQQSVGRALRKSAPTAHHEVATVFIPAVRPLLDLAARMETERNHVVRLVSPAESGLEELKLEPVAESGLGSRFEALAAEAEFAHLLHSGRAIVPGAAAADGDLMIDLTADQEDFVGLPGLLSPEQTAAVLAARDATVRKRASGVTKAVADSGPRGAAGEPDSAWRDVAALRRELHALVGRWAARSGMSHGQIHAMVRAAVPGPPTAEAGAGLLADRRDFLLLKVELPTR